MKKKRNNEQNEIPSTEMKKIWGFSCEQDNTQHDENDDDIKSIRG